MRFLNSYSLQRKIEKKKGLYEKLHYVSLFLKILFLLSLIPWLFSLWWMALSAALLCADIALSEYGSTVMYTVIYRVEDGEITVRKIALDGKETVEERLPLRSIARCAFEEGGKKYYSDGDGDGEDRPLRIVGEGRDFCILADKYMYGIVRYGMEDK